MACPWWRKLTFLSALLASGHAIAIGLDGTPVGIYSDSNVLSLSVPFTTGNGADRIIVAYLFASGLTTGCSPSVFWGSDALTQLSCQNKTLTGPSGNVSGTLSMFYLVAPSANTTQTLTATFPNIGAGSLIVVGYNGVRFIDPILNPAFNWSQASGSQTSSLNTAFSGSWLLCLSGDAGQTVTLDAQLTQRYSTSDSSLQVPLGAGDMPTSLVGAYSVTNIFGSAANGNMQFLAELVSDAAATATDTQTITDTFTASPTYTISNTFTATPSATRTASPTISPTFSTSPTPTWTPTKSPTKGTPTPTRSQTLSSTTSPTFSWTSTITPTNTPTWTPTWTPTITPTATPTQTLSTTSTFTVSPTLTATPSPTCFNTYTPTWTLTTLPTASPFPSYTQTPNWTATPTLTVLGTASPFPTYPPFCPYCNFSPTPTPVPWWYQ